MQKRLVVFSHFDIDNIIDDYVIYYLERLKRIASDIVFVSTSMLDRHEQNKLESLCSKIICRENIGYDFMSYKSGLLESGIDYSAYDEVILCNDSVYGPLYDLQEMFDAMQTDSCDFWGVTKCVQISPHVQSYFLVFKRSVVQSGRLNEFFSKVEILTSKKSIISSYEVGLSSYLKKSGFQFSVYCGDIPFSERCREFFFNVHRNKLRVNKKGNRLFAYIKLSVRETRYIIRLFLKLLVVNDANPTRYFWKYLVLRKCPFIKIILLRTNSEAVSSNKEILEFVGANSAYPVTMAEKHLMRTQNKYKGPCNA